MHAMFVAAVGTGARGVDIGCQSIMCRLEK